MPKLTPERSRERRDGIVRAAGRVFAQYGYEGATVVRLEEETGLSRGAIFHYFADKTELFVAVAVDINARFVDLIVDRGVDEAVRAMVEEAPGILWVILEVQGRIRHDKEFERRLEARAQTSDRVFAWFAARQEDGSLRGDVDAVDLARYVSIVLNGVALRIAVGDPLDIAATLELLHSGLDVREGSAGCR